MNRVLVTVFLIAVFPLAMAQSNRSAELDKGTASGGSRPNEQYFGRQAQLEHEVELARRRYEAAQKRWNDLK